MTIRYEKEGSRHAFRRGFLIAVLIACFLGYSRIDGVSAFVFPAKPVTLVVAFSEGSGVDTIARRMSKKLSERWGMEIVIENRTGGGGSYGADAVAKAAPDGYTLLINTSSHVTNAVLYSKLPYDPIRDFVPIAPISIQPFVLAVSPSSGIRNVAELIARAKKAKPGQIKFSSTGVGSSSHFCAEKFKVAVGIDVLHIPYKGGPEANAAVLSGQATYWFPPVTMAMRAVQQGKLRALAVTGAKRSNVLPNVPTMAEAGVRIEDANWYGIWAPAGILDSIADKLANDIAEALKSPDVREHLANVGAEPMSMTRTEFTRFVQSEVDTVDRIMKVTGIRPFPR